MTNPNNELPTIESLVAAMNAETADIPGHEISTQRLRTILHQLAHGNAVDLQARERQPTSIPGV